MWLVIRGATGETVLGLSGCPRVFCYYGFYLIRNSISSSFEYFISMFYFVHYLILKFNHYRRMVTFANPFVIITNGEIKPIVNNPF
jgi:hypothetical protein